MTLAGTMRLLVVGASGLVGAELARRAGAAGHPVVGAARHIRGLATRALDLGEQAQIERLLADFSPTVVAICSAYPHVDGCERDPERSLRENVGTVRNVIAATAGSNVRLVFYSTDHVFDGSRAAFGESDAVHPLSVYAQHKRRVEELLQRRGNALVARTSYVFGEELARKNFVYQVIEAARTGAALRVPVRQGGSPTWSGWLAEATVELLTRNVMGLVHLSGGESMTKAEWARLILKELRLPAVDVQEVAWAESGQVAPRPERVVLQSTQHHLVQPPLSSILQQQRERMLA
jgi:dTDP-4-dehydrorhamnose reductase